MKVPTEHPLFSLVSGAQRPLRSHSPGGPSAGSTGVGHQGAPVADLKLSGP